MLASIEHTLLRANTRAAEIDELCHEAVEWGFAGVCVNPIFVERCSRSLEGHAPRVVSVTGFPLGASLLSQDVSEVAAVREAGADEIDMVLPIGAALDGHWQTVGQRIAAVVNAAEGAPVKVILETAFLAAGQLKTAAQVALDSGAAYLKTSTGFGPRGATVQEVGRLAQWCEGRAQVKASGGIRDLATCRAMLGAGAARIGTSSGVNIARELQLSPAR